MSLAIYPEDDSLRDLALEERVALMLSVVKGARVLRSEYIQGNKLQPEFFVVCEKDNGRAVMDELGAVFTSLVISKSCAVVGSAADVPEGSAATSVVGFGRAYMLVKGLVDVSKELEKLATRIADMEQKMAGIDKKMAVPDYETKVPEAVREKQAKAKADVVSEIAKLNEMVETYKGMQ